MNTSSEGAPVSGSGLRSTVETLLDHARMEGERQRHATERRMEEITRRLKHVAYLVADLDLRFVIPKLRELVGMFPNGTLPRKKGFDDHVWVDFVPTPSYPVQARLTVGLTPDPTGESVRVTVSAALVPAYLPYEHEACLDLRVASPDTRSFEEFLDQRIVQFVKDYLRTKNPDSPSHEEVRVTDPVCRRTLPESEAAPERYLAHAPSMKGMPDHEGSPLLGASPAENGRKLESRTRIP
jgi:hypothetical protein